MSLPHDGMNFPPKKWEHIYYKYAEWSAWYGSNIEQLINVYSDHMCQPYSPENKFNINTIKREIETYLHVPVASDISATSANLLFGEQPIIRISEAQEKNASASAKATQERLDYLLNKGEVYNKLIESAESASALGGVFLKPNWDTDFLDIPIIDIVQADNAIPYFKWGFLYEVLFHKVIKQIDNVVFRLCEYHEKGVYYNALYKGTEDNFGKRMPLTYLPETELLQDEVRTGINDIMVRYIPNIKPNRMIRGSGLGNSDYQGNEGLFDSIDQVYTSWIKEIKLGQARIIVPEQWLERTNGKFTFNAQQEIFTALDIDPLSAKGQGINQVQFDLRVDEHKTTVEQLVMQAVTDAGYSPQTFGLNIAGNAESGTALNIRERKSSITRGKKQIFFRQAIQDILQMLLMIDKAVFKTPGIDPNLTPSVEFQDSLEFNLDQTSATIEMLNRAQAISVKTKVQMAHPNWSAEEIDMEVFAINQETGIPSAGVNIDSMEETDQDIESITDKEDMEENGDEEI